jgi:signal peptidase II
MHDQPVKFSWSNILKPMILWVSIGTFVLDQITKYWIIFTLEVGRVVEVTPFFNIVHYKNRGAAFGLFHDASPTFRLVFFGLVTLACVAFLLWAIGTSPLWDRFHRFCLALILGGAFGNIKDRVIFQEVTDFLDFYWGTSHWPAFNVADMGISIGVTLLILQSIPWKKRKILR